MNNVKSHNEIRPLTVEKLQNWIEGERERFEILCFGVWNCLDNLHGMLDDNELKYYPKELRKRKRVEYAKLMRQSRKGSYGNK
ncbi:hypothetical protein E0E02_08470 [Streptococcus sp. KCJ4932]|uniref:hypothetical protein n=1 Tax=Streptococcus sp. KCJ4932 TaxID=2545465 RepID=UPI00105629DA|nr:hypothetical protein [Streptococcus sp. KCJ4932]TDE67190.1 hypothetical protein E0E02_08470 [Streptococcus sp. KCJ4932]